MTLVGPELDGRPGPRQAAVLLAAALAAWAGAHPGPGDTSPGRQSHSDTTLYISLVVLYTNMQGGVGVA